MHLRLIRDDIDPDDPHAALLTPRRIRFASEIPKLGLNGFERDPRYVRLRGVVDAEAESFVSANGAYRQGPFWVVTRRDPVPFYLGEHLPRMAQMSVTPEVVDMEPPPGWRGSLQGVLTPRSWNRLVADVWRRERVCHDCGSVPFKPDRLEGHECWSEDRSGPVPVRRLVCVMVLCAPCLEMRHPGLAARNGRGDRAFARLCAVNRIAEDERDAYARLLEERWAARVWDDPVVEWDLSVLNGCDLEIDPSVRFDAGRRLSRDHRSGVVVLSSASIKNSS